MNLAPKITAKPRTQSRKRSSMVINVQHVTWDKLDSLARAEDAPMSHIVAGLLKFYEESEGVVEITPVETEGDEE